MPKVTSLVWGLGFLLFSLAFLILVVYWTGLQDTVSIWVYGERPTAEQKAVVEFKQKQKECAALFVWHTAMNSNNLKNAGEDVEWLAFTAFWNTMQKGYTPCKVFEDAILMLPSQAKEYRWKVGAYYLHWKVMREAKSNDLEGYKRIFSKFAPLLGTQDLAAQLPEHLRQYSCVEKLVRSRGGWFTPRLGLSLDELADRIERAGYRLAHTIETPSTDDKDYRFYCPA